jgi:formylglycine-generating enzyme required for sulfatase activity
VRQLIESGQFKQAEGEFTKWIAEGVDTEKRLELAAFFNQSAPYWLEPHTGMRFVEVPGGSFEIGDQFGEGAEDEQTSWLYGDVDIQPFRLGATEVTQAQWQAIMGSNLSEFKGDALPVERVSWYDVQGFIRKLNNRTGKKFRLPTEAEWEYACREGGRKVRYCNGKDEASKSGIHYNGGETKPVASFSPNSLGLYDMSGNVREWTCSEYKKRYDGSEEKCAVSARLYSVRGGSWRNTLRGGACGVPPQPRLGLPLRPSRISSCPGLTLFPFPKTPAWTEGASAPRIFQCPKCRLPHCGGESVLP